jgi:hypothetical protein
MQHVLRHEARNTYYIYNTKNTQEYTSRDKVKFFFLLR